MSGTRARPIGRALALSVAVCAVAGIVAVKGAAQTAAPAPLVATLGFDGALRPGAPTPLDVRTPPMPDAGPAQLVVETDALAPQTGRATVTTVVPFQAAAGVATRLRVPVLVQDVRRPLRVRVVLAGRVVAAEDVPVDPARVAGRLVVLASDVRAGLGVLHRIDERAVAAYVSADALPSRWQEYTGVDLLVVRDIDPDRLSDAQRAAVVTWVRLGGRLVVIARPGRPLPAFLNPVLPARLGPPRTLELSGGSSAGPESLRRTAGVGAVALVPRPDAAVIRESGAPIAAAAASGDGYVAVWGIDPTAAPLADWTGRARLWADALGSPSPPAVDAAAIAEGLTPRTPVDRFSHVAAGALIAIYLGGLALVRRRRPTPGGAVAGAAAAVLAIVVFASLAAGARGRSTALTQAAVIQQAAGVPLARAVVVAAATVPYGGPVQVVGPPGAAASPQRMTGDLQVVWRDGVAVASGIARSDAPWMFTALTDLPLRTSAEFAADGRSLTTDLGAAGLQAAAVWWHGLVYSLGDLPPGRSVHSVPESGWRRAADLVGDEHASARFFRAPGTQTPGPIVALRHPALVGVWPGSPPAFALAGRGAAAPPATDAVLIVPIGGAPPAAGGQP